MTSLHSHIKLPPEPLTEAASHQADSRLSALAFLCFIAVGGPNINGSLFFEILGLSHCRQECSFSVGPPEYRSPPVQAGSGHLYMNQGFAGNLGWDQANP